MCPLIYLQILWALSWQTGERSRRQEGSIGFVNGRIPTLPQIPLQDYHTLSVGLNWSNLSLPRERAGHRGAISGQRSLRSYKFGVLFSGIR